MLSGFLSIFKLIWELLKLPLCLLLVLLLAIGFSCIFYFWSFRALFKARGRSDFIPFKDMPLWKKIFVAAPKQFILDIANRPLNFFPGHGMIIFEGRQGAGKTSSMVYYISRLQAQYPHLKVITNFAYAKQDKDLRHWKQLVHYNNGFEGVCAAIDELQNWFSSKQSKDFPPEMLSVVTQNRKNKRLILGTAQNFYMLAKDIRTQVTEVHRCLTIGGVFTIVHKVEPVCDSQGNVVKFRHLGWYCWVHEVELRNSYDTYKAIESLSESGFTERKESTTIISQQQTRRKR